MGEVFQKTAGRKKRSRHRRTSKANKSENIIKNRSYVGKGRKTVKNLKKRNPPERNRINAECMR